MKDQEYLTSVYLLDGFPATSFGFEKFSRSSEMLFSYFSFISVCLMVSASKKPKYL